MGTETPSATEPKEGLISEINGLEKLEEVTPLADDMKKILYNFRAVLCELYRREEVMLCREQDANG